MLVADFGTGQLFWKKNGKECFKNLSSRGYHVGRIGPQQLRKHRILWKMYTGRDPDQIDHINGIKTDNRIENLRSVTSAGNSLNRAVYSNSISKIAGVWFNKKTQRWVAKIKYNRAEKCLGKFKTVEEAIASRKAAEAQLGFHPNHGRPQRAA